MAPRVRALDLGAKDHKRLQELAAVGDLPARVLLCRAAGVSQIGTASRLGLNRLTVAKYERVFRTAGVTGLANVLRLRYLRVRCCRELRLRVA